MELRKEVLLTSNYFFQLCKDLRTLGFRCDSLPKGEIVVRSPIEIALHSPMTTGNHPLFVVARQATGFNVRRPTIKHVDCVAQRLELKNWFVEAVYWAAAISPTELDQRSLTIRDELLANLEPEKVVMSEDALLRSFLRFGS